MTPRLLVVGLAVTLFSTDVLACTIIMYEPYAATEGPEIAGLRVAGFQLERGCGSGPGQGDCADIGNLVIELETTGGEPVPAGLGAEITTTTGEFPMSIEPGAAVAIKESALSFTFADGYGQPAIDATVVIQAC